MRKVVTTGFVLSALLAWSALSVGQTGGVLGTGLEVTEATVLVTVATVTTVAVTNTDTTVPAATATATSTR